MDLKLSFTGCSAMIFEINGIDAETEDFGEKYDREPMNAPPYGCGDMKFTQIPPTEKVLNKYRITEGEYYDISSKLEDKLSVGSCGRCS